MKGDSGNIWKSWYDPKKPTHMTHDKMALLSFWITSLGIAWAGDRATKSRCPDSDRFSHYIVMGCDGVHHIHELQQAQQTQCNEYSNVNGMHCSSQNQGVLTSIFQVWKMSTMDRDDKARKSAAKSQAAVPLQL